MGINRDSIGRMVKGYGGKYKRHNDVIKDEIKALILKGDWNDPGTGRVVRYLLWVLGVPTDRTREVVDNLREVSEKNLEISGGEGGSQ